MPAPGPARRAARTTRRPSRGSTTRTRRSRSRPVTWRHIRIIQRFASVAVSENCQYGTPKRRASSPPTQAASSVGSIVVIPSISRDRAHRRLGRVARHRACVAEAEVGVLVAVHVHDRRAGGALLVEREAARPHRHPGHRHAGQEAPARLVVELPRARVPALEQLALAGDQLVDRQAGAGSSARSGSSGRTAAMLLRAALLPHGDEHHRHREQEDHRRDHVDLRRDRHARGAPDEQRERDRRAGVEVRDHEVVDRQREREQRRRTGPRA